MLLAVSFLGALGWGCVRQAQRAERRIPTCRYREFRPLQQAVERYRTGLFAVALIGMFLGPGGQILALCSAVYLIGSRIC